MYHRVATSVASFATPLRRGFSITCRIMRDPTADPYSIVYSVTFVLPRSRELALMYPHENRHCAFCCVWLSFFLSLSSRETMDIILARRVTLHPKAELRIEHSRFVPSRWCEFVHTRNYFGSGEVRSNQALTRGAGAPASLSRRTLWKRRARRP